MNSKVRVGIGIAALVGLALALLDGQGISEIPFRVFSIAGLIATLVFALWERFIWKWKLIRYFTGVPLIAGTWRGELISSYIKPDGTSVPPIPTALHISQTFSRVTVTLFTGESKSVSEHAKLIHDPDGRWRLSWQYVNTPRPGVRDRSERHRGAAEMYIGSQPGEGLEGSYFTDRQTDGEFHLTEWSSARYGSAATALAGDAFADARPYVREA
ncbi:Cap15 family cyclic dinucleotide receptor domain-containing protein [Streptomyces albidoflavus]|uniref:Cap15 family cyclic dinucleotide receptor domain-containing protein n=1 Tax=Streptomyces albidoflavus TaxID=1886 RepID=UPI0033B16510